MMYGLFGKIKTQASQREALIAHLLKGIGSQELEGCYLYVVSRAPDDPEGIWVTEVWRSQEDHRNSLTLESVRESIALARPMIIGFGERFEFTPVGGLGLPNIPSE